MTTSFGNRLNSALNAGGSEKFLQAFETLRQAANDLTIWLRSHPDSQATVQVEPGFPAKIGKQFNVVVRIPAKGVADTLFRAYVDTAGKTSLDFFGDQPVECETQDQVESEVLKFLARPEVNSRMIVYKQLAN